MLHCLFNHNILTSPYQISNHLIFFSLSQSIKLHWCRSRTSETLFHCPLARPLFHWPICIILEWKVIIISDTRDHPLHCLSNHNNSSSSKSQITSSHFQNQSSCTDLDPQILFISSPRPLFLWPLEIILKGKIIIVKQHNSWHTKIIQIWFSCLLVFKLSYKCIVMLNWNNSGWAEQPL